jgi:PAS domain S-box-containing protein
LNYTLSLVENGQECVDVAALHTPDLLILDASLPGDSFALCRQLREQHSFPVLFLIQESAENVDRAFSAGGTDYVPKPVNPMVLKQRVKRLVEARQTERRADESERRWKQGFEQNHAIKLLIDSNTGMIVDANRAACNFYGYPLEEFRQKRVTDLDTTPRSRRGDSPGPATLFNFRHKLANGEERDVKMFSGPIDVDGRTLIYSIVYDNTKRRQAEAAEHDQRAMAEALRKMTAALSSTLDQNDVLDHILRHIQQVVPNDCANIMLIDAGYAHVVRARGYDQRSNSADIGNIQLPIAETANLRLMIEQASPLVIDDVRVFPGWVSFPETTWIRSHVSAPIRLGNHVIGFLNLDSSQAYHFNEYDAERLLAFADQAAIAIRNARLYDRVRRQAAELEQRVRERTAEVEYERQQLRAILDAMAEGVAYTEYVDDQIRVRYINQALTSMTGFDADEWMENSLLLFKELGVDEEDFRRRVTTIYETLVTRGLWHQEVKMRRKDGTEFDMSSVTTRVEGPDGKLVGAVTVMRDVSQERALQAQKTRFVAYASHELRTPITNMKTRLYLLRKQPEKIGDHLRVLEEVTDRMQRLVEDLLDISRFERGIIHLKPQMAALQEIVLKSTVLQEPEAERKGLNLSIELPDESLMVYIDPERVIQVITNLLTNAINYTPTGGSVTVRVSQRLDEGIALVDVEDTGIGISQEHLPHIFQAFYRVVSQVEGTGLGLNISKEIVNLHGGAIWVDSQLGKGSCFSFSLPLLPVHEIGLQHQDVSR